ncbi:MAG: GNAT family N-acetyltransferase [Armatimonadota bacterium]|nr:GNAT family N-acetyltransferase [Armatimonadota bacterium]MDR7451071.1 GNAT family N-acetyltransferase [Armatimonadota bacterium]MDR7465908.1 GNAT family N-acetyltransferase [Armatimonadota bacterium]MDR7493973.1 GNAT family N-acetyltransferase [Armatimonadota bacterium]MDR7498423.1 GNAT family N-acetyltransferase [Armatimonadota bacterium]
MTTAIRPAGQSTEQLPRVVGGREAAPAEWLAWAEEPGHDLVALDDGRVVGGIHVSIVSRTEAWMEALRVHPEAQGRGIGAQLVREAEAVARHYGAAVMRTAVPAHDYGALAVAERSGYRQVTRCLVAETDVTPGPAHLPYDAPVALPRPEQMPALLRFIESTAVLAAWERLLPLGWRFRRLVPELLRGLIKDRRVAAALRPDRSEVPQACALFARPEECLVIALIDGSPDGMQAVFGEIREQAQERGVRRLVVFAPQAEFLAPLGVREWRPHAWCPDGLVVVQKNLAA